MAHARARGAGLILACLIPATSAVSAEEIEVRLQDGRNCTGTRVSSADDSRLRLRIGEPDGYIVYGLAWEDIAEIHLGDDVWTADRFDAFRKRTAVPVSSPEDAALEVRLLDGTMHAGQPDATTDDAQLRLRFGEPDAYIVLAIPWDDIAQIRAGAAVWNSEDLRSARPQIAEQFRAGAAKSERPVGAARAPERGRSSAACSDTALGQTAEQRARPTSPAQDAPRPAGTRPLRDAPRRPDSAEAGDSRVRWIEVDAVAANWDADVEWDGIVLRVWPMNQSGHVVRAAGTLEATLIGEGVGADGRWHGDDNQRLGYWVRSVRPADYGPDGVSFRLEFQNYHPERVNAPWHADQFICPNEFVRRAGAVHVSLVLPSQGVFRASVDQVQLRRFSPLRERYFGGTLPQPGNSARPGSGTRFFPFER